MTGTTNTESENKGNASRKRPLLLSLLCLFSWIYYGLTGFLFLLALLYSGWIAEVISQYIPDQSLSPIQTSLLILGLLLLHAVAIAGTILLWIGKPAGYYLFSVPTILLASFHLLRPEISWISTAVYAILIILFGVFYRKLRNLSDVSN